MSEIQLKRGLIVVPKIYIGVSTAEFTQLAIRVCGIVSMAPVLGLSQILRDKLDNNSRLIAVNILMACYGYIVLPRASQEFVELTLYAARRVADAAIGLIAMTNPLKLLTPDELRDEIEHTIISLI